MYIPHEGPQADLLGLRDIPEILFGGARGGGKTAALLGDFLQDVARYGEHWQGVLFRRSYPELEEVIKQSHKFYSPTGAYWRASSKSWHWANGACLRLRSLESREDASKYQGHEYCVALGTLVDTPTGPKKIEELRFGDAVMTASGVSRVTATLKPRRALCVKVEVNGKSQVHPIDHDFLTDLGWQSYASLQGISAKEFQEESLEWQSLPSLNVHAVCVQQRQRANIPSLETSKVSQTFCKFYEWSSVKPQGLFGLVLSSLKGLTRRLRSLTEELGNVSAHFGGENVNVLYCTTVTSNSQCDCPSCRHLHDAQPPLEQGIDLNALPLQGDVAKRLHAYSALGVRDSTRRYIHQYDSRYPHPYGGWELPMVGESFLTACEISVVGYYDVMDIQVESFNNYITTEARLINKNCWIGWDEVTNWPHNDMFLQMFACLRGSGQQVAARIRCSGNPGGPGHNWVKDRFMIGAHKKGWHPIYDPESNMTRLYIPSRTTDNPSLILNSPNYTRQLRAVGSKELVKAWLEGDWDIVLGAYFDEWSERDHVIPDIDPADLPKKWKIYRAYDHGSYHPFAVLWYTYAGPEFEKQGIERNTIIFLNEWFGANEQGKGLKLAISDVAEGIRRRERAFGRSIEPGPADNQIFEQDGGMPLSELMAAKGVYFERSDKRRIAGWNQVRYRLQTNLVRFCRACKNTISSFPSLQHDDTRQEDVDTTGNDHCADVVRYSCMAWPIEVQPEKVKDDIRDIVTYNELIEASEDLIRQVKRPL